MVGETTSSGFKCTLRVTSRGAHSGDLVARKHQKVSQTYLTLGCLNFKTSVRRSGAARSREVPRVDRIVAGSCILNNVVSKF